MRTTDLFDMKGMLVAIILKNIDTKLVALGYARKVGYLDITGDADWKYLNFGCDIHKSLIERLLDDPEERRILWWFIKKGLAIHIETAGHLGHWDDKYGPDVIRSELGTPRPWFDPYFGCNTPVTSCFTYNWESFEKKHPEKFRHLKVVILPKLYHRMDLEIKKISMDFIAEARNAKNDMTPMMNDLCSKWEAQAYKAFALATGCWDLACR